MSNIIQILREQLGIYPAWKGKRYEKMSRRYNVWNIPTKRSLLMVDGGYVEGKEKKGAGCNKVR